MEWLRVEIMSGSRVGKEGMFSPLKSQARLGPVLVQCYNICSIETLRWALQGVLQYNAALLLRLFATMSLPNLCQNGLCAKLN